MKKGLLALGLLVGAHTFALPIGNPADPALYTQGLLFDSQDPCTCWDAFSLRVGYYGDFVYNRHYDRISPFHGQIEDSRLMTNAGLITLNGWNRLDVFTTLGATHSLIDTQSKVLPDRVEANYETHFSWSVGARAVLWQWGCTYLGAEGQYFSAYLPATRFTVGDDESASSQLSAHFTEYQVGLGIAHRINVFVPYLGVKWSHAHIEQDHIVLLDVTYPNFENKKSWGYAVGVSLVDCERATLTVEGRFADEKALHVNGQIRF